MFQKGDVIAYRLIELTSSWTPEVSSFRVKISVTPFEPIKQSTLFFEEAKAFTIYLFSWQVGKISYYDPESKKVILMPVQEYPIEKKTEEDEDSSSMQPDTSLYKEDGSLEVRFIVYTMS